MALGSGEGDIEQTGRLVALGLGAATHRVSPAQTFLQRPEIAEDPRHQPQGAVRQRMPGVEDRGLLHRDFAVAVVLVGRDSDDGDRPLQAFRLVHRRYQHGIMSRRLFVCVRGLSEVGEQPSRGDRQPSLVGRVLVLRCDLAERVESGQSRLRGRPRFDPLRQIEGVDDGQ